MDGVLVGRKVGIIWIIFRVLIILESGLYYRLWDICVTFRRFLLIFSKKKSIPSNPMTAHGITYGNGPQPTLRYGTHGNI